MFRPSSNVFGRALAGGLGLAGLLVLAVSPLPARGQDSPAEPGSIAIADIQRETQVDFEREILPILKNNCLACHSRTKPKASLVLETPQAILQGGDSGPAAIPGKSQESLILQVAAHQTDPVMPPRNNKAAASNLTPEQLGLLRLWIDQGAQGEVRAAESIAWKPLPTGVNPIYAVALTADGHWAACGRGNQIHLYHLPSQEFIAPLTDSQLIESGIYQQHGIAHHEMVHALAFSPDGLRLASGDFRQVKIWRRVLPEWEAVHPGPPGAEARRLRGSPDGEWLAWEEEGEVSVMNLTSGQITALGPSMDPVTALQFAPDGSKLAIATSPPELLVFQTSTGEKTVQAAVPSALRSLAWCGDTQLAAGGEDGLIRVWKITEETHELIPSGEIKAHGAVVAALASVSSGRLVSGGADGFARAWSLENGEKVAEFHQESAVQEIAVDAEGQRVLTLAEKAPAKLWSMDGKQIAELKGNRFLEEAADERGQDLKVAEEEFAYRKKTLQDAEKTKKAEEERLTKATAAFEAADKAFAEKQAQFNEASQAKETAAKALAEFEAEFKLTVDAYEKASQAAQEKAAQAKRAMAKALELKLPAELASEIQTLSERLIEDSRNLAAKARSLAALEANQENRAAMERGTAAAEAVSLHVQSAADGLNAIALAKQKLAEEAQRVAESAIEEVAAKSLALGQIKPRYEELMAQNTGRRKELEEKINATQKALQTAENELKKTETARGAAETELHLAKKSVEQSEASLLQAQETLAAAESAKSEAATKRQTAETSAKGAEVPLRAAVYSVNHRRWITASQDGTIQTWGAETGRPFDVWAAPAGKIEAILLNGPDQFCAAGLDGAVFARPLTSAWELERVIGSPDPSSPLADRVSALQFSPDGKLLAAGTGEPTRSGDILIWRVDDGELVAKFPDAHSDAVFALDFSRDGQQLASGAADRFVRVHDLKAAQLARSFEGHTHHVLGVSWKADGRTLASAGADNVVKIWDYVTGERKKNIEGFGKEVTGLSYIGITDQIVVGAGDNQVRMVKDNGDTVRRFEGVTDFIYAVAATPNGSVIIAGGQDSLLRAWNGLDGKPLATFKPAQSDPRLAADPRR